jgi:hypothetical protein
MPNDGKKTELELFYYCFLAVDAKKQHLCRKATTGRPIASYMKIFVEGHRNS